MAVKVVCVATHVTANGTDNSHFDVTLNYAVLVTPPFSGTVGVTDISPTGNVNSKIESALKDYLEGSGTFTFSPSDDVLIIPK